jgi:hypothetical protein
VGSVIGPRRDKVSTRTLGQSGISGDPYRNALAPFPDINAVQAGSRESICAGINERLVAGPRGGLRFHASEVRATEQDPEAGDCITDSRVLGSALCTCDGVSTWRYARRVTSWTKKLSGMLVNYTPHTFNWELASGKSITPLSEC